MSIPHVTPTNTPPPETDEAQTDKQASMLDSIYTELENSKETKRSSRQKLLALTISIVLFASLGLFRDSLTGVALLIGVIFLHELGHFISMKLLRYEDVQMFFIPMLGAAVSGNDPAPHGSKRVLVSLMGPVPGILLGIGTGIAHLRTGEPLLADATRLLLFINVLNLLPFHPLDGGHIAETLIFSRHPRTEIGFKIATTLMLFGLGILLQAWIVGFFAFTIMMALPMTAKMASTAHILKKEIPSREDLPQDIPRDILRSMVELLDAKLPESVERRASLYAGLAREIWTRARSIPPSIMASIALIIVHIFMLLLGIFAFFLFEGAVLYHDNHSGPASRGPRNIGHPNVPCV